MRVAVANASCDLATSMAVSNCVWLSAVASGMCTHSDQCYIPFTVQSEVFLGAPGR
jgi:hypothetical protein